jgi:hypothetical protein
MRIAVAVVLAVLALVLWGASYLAAGNEFKEPLGYGCFDHAPAGWYEAVDVDATLDDVPPRLHCTLTNTQTGEVVTWDSGLASLPVFVPALLSFAGSLGLLATDVRSRWVRRRQRS